MFIVDAWLSQSPFKWMHAPVRLPLLWEVKFSTAVSQNDRLGVYCPQYSLEACKLLFWSHERRSAKVILFQSKKGLGDMHEECLIPGNLRSCFRGFGQDVHSNGAFKSRRKNCIYKLNAHERRHKALIAIGKLWIFF